MPALHDFDFGFGFGFDFAGGGWVTRCCDTLLRHCAATLCCSKITLNYRDADGDLIAIHDEDDLALYVAERPHKNLVELEVTPTGTFSSYTLG